MKAFLFFLLIILCHLPVNAQPKNSWPYSKGVYYINFTDSTGITTKIFRRTTIMYDTAGRVLSNFSEENNTQLDTNNFKKLATDTFLYDNKGRLIRKINYAFRDGFPDFLGGEDSVFIDSANFNGGIKFYRSRKNEVTPDRWNVVYKNINRQDSIIIKGLGGIMFQNPYLKQNNYYTLNKLDSSVYLRENNGKLEFNYLEIYSYPSSDTIIKAGYNSSHLLTVIFKYGYDIKTAKLLKREMIGSTDHYLDKYQYFNNGQVEDYKSYRYNFTKKIFELAFTTNKVFDQYGALVRNLSMFYQNNAWYNGNLHLYFYTLRKPAAKFSAIDKCLGDSINFADESKDAQKYLWEFGDGKTSTLKSPTHFYTNPGTYNVKLSVTANSGLKDSITKQIIIHPVPDAGFSVTKDSAQFAYIFTPNDTTQKSYLWNLGDSTVSSTEKIAKYTFPKDDNYKISLQVTTENNCIFTTDTTLSITSNIEKQTASTVFDFSVYPNPAREELFITYKLAANTPLSITITDATGKEIFVLTKPNEQAGKQVINFSASTNNLKPGIYLIKLISGNIIENKKAIILK